MKKADYKKRRNALFARWKTLRPEYESDGNHFVRDGIVDFDKWQHTTPKILFLLKEMYCNPEEWEPEQGITTNSGTFSRNIARWCVVLQTLFKMPSKRLTFAEITLPETITDIALVEVKKVNEGRATSDYHDINRFSARDREFLKEHIELIQPEVILCCGTIDAYSDFIYGDEPWDEIIYCAGGRGTKRKRCCYKHRNRLIIDFYHPSIRGRHEEAFVTLCEMIQKRRVFDHFSWNKTKR